MANTSPPPTPFVALWALVVIPLLPGLLDSAIALIVMGGCLSIIALVMSVTALADLEASAPAGTIIPAPRATAPVGDADRALRPLTIPRRPRRRDEALRGTSTARSSPAWFSGVASPP
jgi:hypothetical protein